MASDGFYPNHAGYAYLEQQILAARSEGVAFVGARVDAPVSGARLSGH